MERIEDLLEKITFLNVDYYKFQYENAKKNHNKNINTYKDILLELLNSHSETDEYKQLTHQIASRMIDIKNKTQTLYIQ